MPSKGFPFSQVVFQHFRSRPSLPSALGSVVFASQTDRGSLDLSHVYTTCQRINKCDVTTTIMVVAVTEERMGTNTALEINVYSSNPNTGQVVHPRGRQGIENELSDLRNSSITW